MKEIAHKSTTDRAERLRRANHLRDVIVERAQERGDSPAAVARTMDMSVGHWYRIKKEPIRLGSLTLDRIHTLAGYIGWPRSQVMVAIGWLDATEVNEVLSAEKTLKDALRRLQRSGLVNGLATPISKASEEHQVLMARLLLLAESAAAAPAGAGRGHQK